MAKLTITVAVLLLVIALAQARSPFYLKENDITTEDVSSNEHGSDHQTTVELPTSILLPRQKLQPEPETKAQPETAESGKPETENDDFIPLTVINYHPINRHFRHHPSLTLRNRRPCHHHHRLGKPWFHHRQISFGNDMLVSRGDSKEEVREIPARWLKFPNGDAHVHKFRVWRDDDLSTRGGFRGPHDFHRRHHHEMEEEKERQKHEHKTGFITKIRKFLDHF